MPVSQSLPSGDAYRCGGSHRAFTQLRISQGTHTTQRRIERIASEMAACAKPLLRNAKQILFVDPYFNPQAPRFQRPLREFLQAVAQRPAGIPITCIEIHTGHTKAGTKSFFDDECAKHLPSIIPSGIKIRLVRWHQDYLHNRFILTEPNTGG